MATRFRLLQGRCPHLAGGRCNHRERSNGKRSLDDFASTFFGEHAGNTIMPMVYSFDDLVSGLDDIQPYNWRDFFITRLTAHDRAPLEGLTKTGYKLVFTDKKSDFKSRSGRRRRRMISSFLSALPWTRMEKSPSGMGSSCFRCRSFARDDNRRYKWRTLFGKNTEDAVVRAKNNGPIEIIVKAFERYRTVSIDYHDGPRYPHLEKISSRRARQDI